MTGLIERGADLLVTVSPLARCYIFITWVLYLSSMNENPSIAGVKTISPAPLLTGKKKKEKSVWTRLWMCGCRWTPGSSCEADTTFYQVFRDKHLQREKNWTGRSEEECEVRCSKMYLASMNAKTPSSKKNSCSSSADLCTQMMNKVT